MKLSQDRFNDLMEHAIITRKNFPNADISTIATLVCSDYKSNPTHAELLMQVTMNLVNLERD